MTSHCCRAPVIAAGVEPYRYAICSACSGAPFATPNVPRDLMDSRRRRDCKGRAEASTIARRVAPQPLALPL